MDKVEPVAGTTPQAISRPCRIAMYRPRERTVQELLRRTQKISFPRPSPVHTDGARMQGPGVKEECCTCWDIVAAEQLQQCSACDRGFHTACLDPLVNIVAPGGHWCCGQCDINKSWGEDPVATDKTPGGSMTSSQNTGGQWNSTASGGKKKLTHTRGLKEVVQQEEAILEDSKWLQTASHEGEASRKSKRGRPLKSTAQVLPLKRRRADAGICQAKPEDVEAPLNVPNPLGKTEEVEVEPILRIDRPACSTATGVLDEKLSPVVVKAESKVADVDKLGSRAGSINDVDKVDECGGTKLKDSDGSFQSLAMKDRSPKSTAVVALPKIPDISVVEVMVSGESDAPHKVSEEKKLQDTGFEIPAPSTTSSNIPLNVGLQPFGHAGSTSLEVLASEQQVKEQACKKDHVSAGKVEENHAQTHSEKEIRLSEQLALDSTGKSTFEVPTSSVSSLISPPAFVRLSSPPPLNSSCPSVSNTSSISTASPFVGFQAQSRDVINFTSSVTLHFSKPALDQGGDDGKDSLVAKSLFQASRSSPSPSPSPSSSTSPSSKLESLFPSGSSPHVEDRVPSSVSLLRPVAVPSVLPPDVNVGEALDSQLSNLVSGLPVPAQRARKGSQASFVVDGNGLVTQLARKLKAQSTDLPQSGRVSREFNVPSGRDQGLKNVLPKVLENGTSRLESDETLSGRSKEWNPEDDRDGSPSNLLVEDVKVCDTCGNAGYEELLAVCSGCSEGAEHTYCMRFQIDSLPEGEWFCETCQMKQRQGGPRLLERIINPSKSLGRSISINNRPKPVSMQNNTRSRLTERLNNKKSRLTPVRKSPSKAPLVQMPVKRLSSDLPMSPVSRKLPTESSIWGASSNSPPSTVPVSTSFGKPSLTRESTLKSGLDTGKVKFLAPSAVANFSSSARANAAKSAVVSSQPLKTAAAGQAGNKSSRFASLSSISESSIPLNKPTSLSTSRAPLTTSPTPALSKSSSGKLSADHPALTKPSSAKSSTDFPFLLNPNSRQGNGLKVSGQLKSSRDGSVPDVVALASSGREALSYASQASGSKLMRLGRSASSSGLSGEPRPSPDTPRPPLEFGRGPQRAGQTGEPRPTPDTPRPTPEHGRGTQRSGHLCEPRPSPDPPRHPLEPGRMTQRSGPGSGVAGLGLTQDALKAGGKDKSLCRSEPALGLGSAVAGKGILEPPGFPGKQSKPSTSVWSAPWLGDSNSTRCFSCKAFGHSAQDCSGRNLSASEQKATSGVSNSPGTSPRPLKSIREAVPVFSDIDAHVSAVGLKAGSEVRGNSGPVLHGLQSATESVPGGGSSDSEKSKPLLPSPAPTDPYRRSSSFKSPDTPAAGSRIPSLLNSTSFQQLVTGQTPPAVSSTPNWDISSNIQGLKAEYGGSNPWIPGGASDNEGPPGVPGIETAQVDSKIAALPVNVSLVVKSEGGSPFNPSEVAPAKLPQGHVTLQPSSETAAGGGPAPPVLQRVHPPAWAPRLHWLEGLPPHSVQGQGLGHVGYPSGLVQSFSPPGSVIYGQSPPVSYLTSQPPPPLPPYASAPPIAVPIPTPPPTSAALFDAAVPSAAVAWRGAFEVNDGHSTIVFDEILAHVSTKAVAKVHEVATALPQQLRLEQVQCSLDLETWPRQFSIRPPTDGSIALYFFADDGESFEKFRHNLVEKMVSRDLVLRAQVDDAELLIFPSDKLSEKFQRWHGHMFLWGVFRARKQAAKMATASAFVVTGPLVPSPCMEVAKIPPYFVPSAAPVCSIISKIKESNGSIIGYENAGEVDMEVDMEGGKELGVSDKAVKRPDSANPPSTPALSPTGASTRTLPGSAAAMASAPEVLAVGAEGDKVQGKSVSIKMDDLDLPPGFAPALALPPTPVNLEPPSSGVSLPPGFAKKMDAQKQVDFGSTADAADASEMVGVKLKRSLSSVEIVKSSNAQHASPLPAPTSRENEGHAHSSRPSTTKRSRSLSRSPIRQKERDKGRDRLSERVKERERRDMDPRHGHDRARDRGREVHRGRDRDREYEREKDRWDRSKERERERARPREKDRGRERERARERERERERERLSERGKDRKHRPRDIDQDHDSRPPRYRRSRSRSRSRTPARRKGRSRSPGFARRKARSRTPPRPKSRSPSASRRYRRLSVSGSDSPDSQSLEILQGSAMAGTRSRKSDKDNLPGKRNASDKEVGDKSSRLRWKARPADDTRSGSAGASNSRTVGRLGHPSTVPVSRSVTPLLDTNEGVSEAFSAEAAAASTSLPDLNTDSVESGVAFHDFLPADDSVPSQETETAGLMAEQTLFPGANRGAAAAAVTPARMNLRSDSEPPVSARERWGCAVSSLGFAVTGSRLEYNHQSVPRAASGYQFLHTPRMDSDSVHSPNPDLELALGGRERSPEVTVPLPLFADGHSRSLPDLAFPSTSKSPDLRVGLSTPPSHLHSRPQCPRGGGTASLSLSLSVPQYRKEGNSWVEVEERGRGGLVSDDVDFALTL